MISLSSTLGTEVSRTNLYNNCHGKISRISPKKNTNTSLFTSSIEESLETEESKIGNKEVRYFLKIKQKTTGTHINISSNVRPIITTIIIFAPSSHSSNYLVSHDINLKTKSYHTK